MGVSCTSSDHSKAVPQRDMKKRDLKGISMFSKIQSVEKDFQSLLKLEGKIKTQLPIALKQKFPKYGISYKIRYGKQPSLWVEMAESLEHINQRAYNFDYILNLKDQIIKIEIEFRPRKEAEAIKRVIIEEENKSNYEKMDTSFVIIKISAEFSVHDLLMAKGEFILPKTCDFSQLKATLTNEETKTDPLDDSSPVLQISLKEDKPANLKKIRFTIAGKFEKKGHIMITIYEIVGNNRKFIYETLPISVNNAQNPLNYFEPIEINSDWFEDEMISTKIIELEAKEVFPDSNKKLKVYATCTLKLKEIISLGDGDVITKDMMSATNKIVGNITISDSTIQPSFSFIDFKIHRGINIVPIIVIDYSLSNLTFDDQKWIHSLKKGSINDYLTVIDHITNAYQNLCSYMLAFGIGARTIPK